MRVTGCRRRHGRFPDAVISAPVIVQLCFPLPLTRFLERRKQTWRPTAHVNESMTTPGPEILEMQRNRRRFAASRRMLGLAAVVATGVVAACSESSAPTAVRASQGVAQRSAMDRSGSSAQNGAPQEALVSALLREDALGAPITVSKVISRNGGVINIPAT